MPEEVVHTHGKIDIGEYTVHLRNVHLPMGLKVDDVQLTGKALTVCRDPIEVSASEEGKMRVHVSDAALSKFLEHKSPAGLRRFHVTSHEERLVILAVKKVLVDLKVKAVCSLAVEDRRLVNVVLESVDVAGADIRNLLQAQLDKLNPVIDISILPFRAEIDHASVDAGGVTLAGRIVP